MATQTTVQEVQRISPQALSQRIAQGESVITIDVRTTDARILNPVQIPHARWLPLAEVVQQAQTLPRESLIAAYWTWPEDASSARAALWLQAEGFNSVFVLEGGLRAWQDAGYPTVPLQQEQAESGTSTDDPTASISVSAPTESPAHAYTFLPGLAQSYLSQNSAPIKKELTVLFIDIANSTETIANQPAEVALDLVQRFMGVVTEIALENCGDVKDYEGDGALLYFESVTEAVQAALAMRKALVDTQLQNGHPPLEARISLNVGDIIIGVIGVALRRSVALIGPSINLASRLLRQIPPGGIIATQAVVERLQQETPTLAEQFELLDERLELKGFEKEYVTAFHMPSIQE